MSTPALALCGATLPATTPDALEKIFKAQDILLNVEQVEIPTEHVIHGGMYARTIRMLAGVVLAGALMKVPTMLAVNGHALVFIGDGWTEIDGYNVVPASKGRKQLFVSIGPVEITMVFPTKALTVEDAEREFTDEWEMLLSNRQDASKVNITGE